MGIEFFFNSPGYWWAEDWDSSEEAKDRTWWAQKATQATYYFSKIGKSNQIDCRFVSFFFN